MADKTKLVDGVAMSGMSPVMSPAQNVRHTPGPRFSSPSVPSPCRGPRRVVFARWGGLVPGFQSLSPESLSPCTTPPLPPTPTPHPPINGNELKKIEKTGCETLKRGTNEESSSYK